MNRISPERSESARLPTDVSLSENLVREAKNLGVNISHACEQGLEEEVKRAKMRQWLTDNSEGFEAWDSYVDGAGIPLTEFRKF